jgi:hypothetical protein
MDEGRSLQGLAGRLLRELGGGQLSLLRIDQRQQFRRAKRICLRRLATLRARYVHVSVGSSQNYHPKRHDPSPIPNLEPAGFFLHEEKVLYDRQNRRPVPISYRAIDTANQVAIVQSHPAHPPRLGFEEQLQRPCPQGDGSGG